MALSIDLKEGKKLYFASDFHLGTPDQQSSLAREKKITRWLDFARQEAAAIFLLGDIFDFWFEYKKVVPKGFVRFQGKLAEIVDAGIPIYVFTGNHDLWMFDYFEKEFGIPVFREPQELVVKAKKLLVGHGDGLGPGDRKYKQLKKLFTSRLAQRAFAFLHPRLGVGLAHKWSRQSRLANTKYEDQFYGDNEHLLVYCKEIEAREHHDYYIFGHRHLVLDMEVSANSRYLNAGDWVNHANYIVFDGQTCEMVEYPG
jgi:UDP-2,3-diacylglucosamine hydrolase